MDQSSIDAFINDLSDQAAGWYTVVTGNPVIMGPQSREQATMLYPQRFTPPPPQTVSFPSFATAGGNQFVTLGILGILVILLLRK